MAQAVERRLPAIYDALDSRNNKVYLGFRLKQSRRFAHALTPSVTVWLT